VCIIEGIPEWRTALQIEWKWKQLTRLEKKEKRPLPRRLLALSRLLSLEKPTKTAIPYQWYPDGPPQIRWSLPEDEALYLRLTGPKPALLAMPLSLSYRPDPSVSNETESTLPGPSSPPWPHVSPGHLVERRSENESVGDGIEYFPVARTEEEAHGKREA
jgi:hypothetical protein